VQPGGESVRAGRRAVPALHVDTGHNYPEVIDFRDRLAERVGLRPGGWSHRAGPGSTPAGLVDAPGRHPQSAADVPLLTASTSTGFDAVFGGGRRDEERARAKERSSACATRSAVEPAQTAARAVEPLQRRHAPGEHVRVFPHLQLDELDVWRYIQRENSSCRDLLLPPARGVPRDGNVAGRGPVGRPTGRENLE